MLNLKTASRLPGSDARNEVDSIDDVVRRLQAIIQWSKNQSRRIGYFAALYLRVTATIRSQLGTGFFDDDARMETMDENFAGRYFLALEQYHEDSPDLLHSWKLALDATAQDDLIIVQHLLAAMNPHISIDLAVAAAKTCPGDSIDSFHDDFNRINDVLTALVPTVIAEIDDLSPWIRLLMDFAEAQAIDIVDFGIEAARDVAWEMAVRLAHSTPEQQQELIAERDGVVSDLGREILAPGFPWQGVLDLVESVESKDVVLNIDTLDQGTPLPHKPHLGPVDGKLPNQVYYFEIAQGSWTGTFTFQLTSWRGLWSSGIGLKNQLLFSAMAVWQAIFGDATLSSTIETFPHRGEAGVARNDFRIFKSWFRLFTSHESYHLAPNGTGVKVDAHVRFGPIPFLFREHDVYPAIIFDGGFRALYFMKLLGARFLGKYRVRADRNQVHSLLENDWAMASEVLDRVQDPD